MRDGSQTTRPISMRVSGWSVWLVRTGWRRGSGESMDVMTRADEYDENAMIGCSRCDRNGPFRSRGVL